jgi:predicted Zn-dependent protease
VEAGELDIVMVRGALLCKLGVSGCLTHLDTQGSVSLTPGDLPADEALARLGTGLCIGDLWYLNFSDRPAGRVTGMTRFATFWAEDGRIVAPVLVMRFDDSLLDLFGARLVGFTSRAEELVDNGTYGGRSLVGCRAPGMLVEGMEFTL